MNFLPVLGGKPIKPIASSNKTPINPGLQFKQIRGELYSVRIGLRFRALGKRNAADEITWFWIGTHAEYVKLLNG